MARAVNAEGSRTESQEKGTSTVSAGTHGSRPAAEVRTTKVLPLFIYLHASELKEETQLIYLHASAEGDDNTAYLSTCFC